MKLEFGLLMLLGSLGLAACGANKTSRDSGAEAGSSTPVEGAACSVEGQQSDCAKDGYPYACGPCQGHWLLCQNGKWMPIHCEKMGDAGKGDAPPPADAPLDLASAADTRGVVDITPDRVVDSTAPDKAVDSAADRVDGTSSVPIEGGPCSVEGQASECAKDGYPAACGACMGHWLVCQNGKWIHVHCDPPASWDAAVARDGADVSLIADSRPAGTLSIDGRRDSTDGPELHHGYLVFAMEVFAFEECGTTNLVWADVQSPTIQGNNLLPAIGPVCVPIDGGMAPCPGKIWVELEGTIVSGGTYGHMGKYSQQLNIRRYIAASLTEPVSCPFLSPVYPN